MHAQCASAAAHASVLPTVASAQCASAAAHASVLPTVAICLVGGEGTCSGVAVLTRYSRSTYSHSLHGAVLQAGVVASAFDIVRVSRVGDTVGNIMSSSPDLMMSAHVERRRLGPP